MEFPAQSYRKSSHFYELWDGSGVLIFETMQVRELTGKLENWFEAVETDRQSIADEWHLNPESGW